MAVASLFSLLRRRRFVWLALTALCLQLLAMNVGSLHAIGWLTAGAFPAAMPPCHSVAAETHAHTAADGHVPSPVDGDGAGGFHCPFCHLAASVILPSDEASFPRPEPILLFVPADDAALQPSVPDLRHAPTRAPPLLFPLA